MILLISPAMAGDDQFNITTTLASPAWYLVDYGQGTTAYLYNYSFATSVNYATANQTWQILGSNATSSSTVLDTQTGDTFTAGIAQNFSITAPSYYRYYYIYLQDGFTDRASTLTAHLYTLEGDTPTPYATVTPSPPAPGIPMLPAGKHEIAPVQWISDNLLWVVVGLVVVVGLIISQRR